MFKAKRWNELIELKFKNINSGVSKTLKQQYLKFSPINFILLRHIDAHDE